MHGAYDNDHLEGTEKTWCGGVDCAIGPGMYANEQSHIRVGDGYSDEFDVKVSVHQGLVLSPLLFIIVLETLSCEFHSGVPWEDLYADDLVIIAESRDRAEGKCRKDEDHDLWYGPGPPAQFR